MISAGKTQPPKLGLPQVAATSTPARGVAPIRPVMASAIADAHAVLSTDIAAEAARLRAIETGGVAVSAISSVAGGSAVIVTGPPSIGGSITSTDGTKSYSRVRRIAVGNHAIVWLVRDSEDNYWIAKKIKNPIEKMNDEAMVRYVREMELLGKFPHPRLVGYHDHFITRDDEGDHLVMILEKAPGRTLADVISEGPVDERSIIEIGNQGGEAIVHLNRNKAHHRDLKPQNMMVVGPGRLESREPDGSVVRSDEIGVRVLDLGMAKSELVETMDGSIGMGSPAWMSYDQLHGKPITLASDVQALALLQKLGKAPGAEALTVATAPAIDVQHVAPVVESAMAMAGAVPVPKNMRLDRIPDSPEDVLALLGEFDRYRNLFMAGAILEVGAAVFAYLKGYVFLSIMSGALFLVFAAGHPLLSRIHYRAYDKILRQNLRRLNRYISAYISKGHDANRAEIVRLLDALKSYEFKGRKYNLVGVVIKRHLKKIQKRARINLRAAELLLLFRELAPETVPASLLANLNIRWAFNPRVAGIVRKLIAIKNQSAREVLRRQIGVAIEKRNLEELKYYLELGGYDLNAADGKIFSNLCMAMANGDTELALDLVEDMRVIEGFILRV